MSTSPQPYYNVADMRWYWSDGAEPRGPFGTAAAAYDDIALCINDKAADPRLDGCFNILDQIAADGLLRPHDLSTPEGYREAWELEVSRCGLPIPERDIALLDLLQEECGEVIQERSKLRRSAERAWFRRLSAPDGPTVIERLTGEIFDVMVLIAMLSERGYITQEAFDAHKEKKLAKLRIFSPEIF